MTSRRLLLALALLVLPALAAAQSKSDAFAGKIPPVSGQLFRTAGRLELTLGGAMSLNDAFFTKYFGSARLAYHLTEFWSVGVNAQGGAALATNSAVLCSASVGCSDAGAAQLRQVPGRIRAIVGLEGAWTPVYGKLNVLAEGVGHFDVSILAGADAILHDGVLSREDALNGVTPASKTALGGHFGLAARFFLAPWAALRFQVADYVYGVDVPNNAALGKDWQNQLFTELGFSFFFPTGNRPGR